VPVLDALEVERRLAGERPPRVVVLVHAHGHGADGVVLRELCDAHGAALVEDCRAAVGAVVGAHDRQVGTIGHSGCFSFADGRQLPVGEGGMVTTADDDVAARVRLLRAHAMTSGTWDRHRGHSDSYDVVAVGFNFRLDEPRAALGASRLRRLRADLQARRDIARALRSALEDVDGVRPCHSAEGDAASSHGGFPVLLDGAAERDRAVAGLRAAGLTAWTEPLLADLPRARTAADRLVVVGLEPDLPVERAAALLAS